MKTVSRTIKRKRKEHLAGISVRKFVGQKKSEVIKRTFRDKTLKAAGRKRLERTMRGMAEYFADVAKDRPRYFARFVKTWQAVYELSAVKRGNRLGWVNPPDKKYLFPTKLIRQSPKEDRLLFWHEVGAADMPTSMKPKEKLNPETLANELVEVLAKANAPLTAGQLRDLARERFGRKNGDEAYVFLVKNEKKLGVIVRKLKGSNINLYSAGVLPL